jgi:hypothetical protein
VSPESRLGVSTGRPPSATPGSAPLRAITLRLMCQVSIQWTLTARASGSQPTSSEPLCGLP